MEDATTNETPTETPEAAPDSKTDPNSAQMWRGRIARCKRTREDLIKAWADLVDRRRGKPFGQESDTDRVNVNLDWSLTKGKHTQLASQMPQVYLTPKIEEIKQLLGPFAQRLNDVLTKAEIGAAADESVLDAINASGIGVVLASYDSTFVMKDMPIDPANPLLTMPTKQIIDRKYSVRRLSPSDLLWPTEFEGSNFDDCDWLGHSGCMFWSQAKREFNLTDEDKEKILGAKGTTDNLRDDTDGEYSSDDPVVEYDEIFYWTHRFVEDEKYFKKISRIVFVKGKKEPVVNEEWKGQKFDSTTGKYTGSCKFPIRILTLTYISDDAIPPSDSAIVTPQIEELIKSRTQMIMQRDRSMPIRWGNTNLLDPDVISTFMRGEYQAVIPTNGDGERALGEIARANYPPEDFAFDKVIKGDITEQFGAGANQVGVYSQGEKSASEAKIVQANFQTRVSYERARVGKFIVGIAEVIGGFIALYEDDVDPLIKQNSGEILYYIRPDSTVLLDAEQRIEKLMKLLNLVGKSGFINPEPIINEIVALHGVDPNVVMTKPNQPPPDQPNIGYSFKGEDMGNPVVLAILMRAGQMPTPQELEQATNALKTVQAKMAEVAAPAMLGMGTNVPAEGTPPVPPGVGPVGQEPPADARPAWTPMPRVSKRIDELGG